MVGSARPGDDEDEDPPLNGQILLGWHGTEYREDARPSRQELLARVQHATRPHALDVQTSCRSAPSFYHDGRGKMLVRNERRNPAHPGSMSGVLSLCTCFFFFP